MWLATQILGWFTWKLLQKKHQFHSSRKRIAVNAWSRRNIEYIESNSLKFIYECFVRARRVLTFSALRFSSSRGVSLCDVSRAIYSTFFFFPQDVSSRASSRKQECRVSRARISRRWKSRCRLRDVPVCNLMIDSPTFSLLFPFSSFFSLI